MLENRKKNESRSKFDVLHENIWNKNQKVTKKAVKKKKETSNNINNYAI